MKVVAQAVREGCEKVCASIDGLTEAVKALSSVGEMLPTNGEDAVVEDEKEGDDSDVVISVEPEKD